MRWSSTSDDDKCTKIVDDKDTDNVSMLVKNKCEAYIYGGSHAGQNYVDMVNYDGGSKNERGQVGELTNVEAGTINEGGEKGDDGGVEGICDGGYGTDIENNKDEAADIMFDDSEEERALGSDDEFGFVVEPPPVMTNLKNRLKSIRPTRTMINLVVMLQMKLMLDMLERS